MILDKIDQLLEEVNNLQATTAEEIEQLRNISARRVRLQL